MRCLTLALSAGTGSFTTVYGQNSPPVEWQRPFGGSQFEEGFAVDHTLAGGFVMAGCSSSLDGDASAVHGDRDGWLVGVNADGTLLWQQAYGGHNADEFKAVRTVPDGGFIAAGYALSHDSAFTAQHGDRDLWVVRTNAEGSLLWQRVLGGSGRDEAYAVALAPDGGFIVVGMTTNSDGNVQGSHGLWDGWVMKLDDTGELVWQRCLGGSQDDWLNGVEVMSDGRIMIIGVTASSDGDVVGQNGGEDAWVIALDPEGGTLWQRCMGSMYTERAYAVCAASGGDVVVVGTSMASLGDSAVFIDVGQVWLARLDATGQTLWQTLYGGNEYDVAYSVAPTDDGGFVLLGSSWSFDDAVSHNQYGKDLWGLRVTDAGELLWERAFGGYSDWDDGHCVLQTEDGGYLFCGTTWSIGGDVVGNHGGGDAWLVKVSPEDVGISQHFAPRSMVAPNPNNGRFDLYLDMPSNSAKAKLTTSEGRLVTDRLRFTPGLNQVDLPSLPAGAYVLRIDEQGRAQNLRIVILP